MHDLASERALAASLIRRSIWTPQQLPLTEGSGLGTSLHTCSQGKSSSSSSTLFWAWLTLSSTAFAFCVSGYARTPGVVLSAAFASLLARYIRPTALAPGGLQHTSYPSYVTTSSQGAWLSSAASRPIVKCVPLLRSGSTLADVCRR